MEVPEDWTCPDCGAGKQEFELDPPVAVNVLEGTIKGTIKQPVEGLVPKPGVRYPPTIVPPEEVDTVSTATQRVRAAVDKGTP